jgi:aminoglycoside phosphotransferase (APT) family kinase protein
MKPDKLWKTGTYWHLKIRPDELAALTDAALKKAAPAINQKLQQAKYKTFVHGDAKLENFCFSKDGLLLFTSNTPAAAAE